MVPRDFFADTEIGTRFSHPDLDLGPPRRNGLSLAPMGPSLTRPHTVLLLETLLWVKWSHCGAAARAVPDRSGNTPPLSNPISGFILVCSTPLPTYFVFRLLLSLTFSICFLYAGFGAIACSVPSVCGSEARSASTPSAVCVLISLIKCPRCSGRLQVLNVM